MLPQQNQTKWQAQNTAYFAIDQSIAEMKSLLSQVNDLLDDGVCTQSDLACIKIELESLQRSLKLTVERGKFLNVQV